MLNYEIIENPYWKEPHRRGILAAELLAKHKVDVLLTKEELHKGGAYYALQDNFIEIRKIDANTFEELLNRYGGVSRESGNK